MKFKVGDYVIREPLAGTEPMHYAIRVSEAHNDKLGGIVVWGEACVELGKTQTIGFLAFSACRLATPTEIVILKVGGSLDGLIK